MIARFMFFYKPGVTGEEELVVTGYTDASFQTDKDDSKSQSGFVFKVNGGAASWKSSKQETLADSTTEAEYIAASEAAKEGVWIKKFLIEFGVFPNASSPLDLYCDNSGAIAKVRSQEITRRVNTLCGDFISFESSSIVVKSRYAKYTQT